MSSGEEIRVTDRLVRVNGAHLQTQAFGDPGAPPVLLIMGIMSSMLWWPEMFCEGLAQQGRFVLRYDHRDTGLSTHYPQGEPGYSFEDLVDDSIAVLRAYGLDTGHVVGMSMGGIIAQEVALRYRRHVRTLTVISSSPLGVVGLPPPTNTYQEHSMAADRINWSDPAAIADFLRRDSAMLASSRHPHDAEATGALIARDMARAPSFASATNHFVLLGGEASDDLHASRIEVPVLAIHGTADPLFPIGHGEAFTSAIPQARLHRIEGGGHEVHDLDIEEMVREIIDHTAI